MKHILFVEDNLDYANILSKILRNKNYMVTTVHNPVEAIDLFEKIHKEIHLAIIDLDLEPINGIQVAELLYKDNPNLPIMILTGSVDDEDEMRALDHGISEYVKKSVSFSVLLSRIKHTMNQSKNMKHKQNTHHSHIEQLTLDAGNLLAIKDDIKIELTLLEFNLMKYFLENKNRIIDRDELLEEVWQYRIEDKQDSRVVDTCVKNVRKKLGVKSIFTVRGVGYRWNE